MPSPTARVMSDMGFPHHKTPHPLVWGERPAAGGISAGMKVAWPFGVAGRGKTLDSQLAGAPGVDFLDQLRFDPGVDVCGFPFHAGELGRGRARRLIIPVK